MKNRLWKPKCPKCHCDTIKTGNVRIVLEPIPEGPDPIDGADFGYCFCCEDCGMELYIKMDDCVAPLPDTFGL